MLGVTVRSAGRGIVRDVANLTDLLTEILSAMFRGLYLRRNSLRPGECVTYGFLSRIGRLFVYLFTPVSGALHTPAHYTA